MSKSKKYSLVYKNNELKNINIAINLKEYNKKQTQYQEKVKWHEINEEKNNSFHQSCK